MSIIGKPVINQTQQTKSVKNLAQKKGMVFMPVIGQPKRATLSGQSTYPSQDLKIIFH